MSDTRIIDLPTKSTMDGDEYIALDGSTNGTFKYPLADVYPTITLADIEAGTSTTASVVTPAVFNSAVESVVDTWLDEGDTLLSSTTISLWEDILE